MSTTRPTAKRTTRALAAAAILALVAAGCGDDEGTTGATTGRAAATICVGGEFSTRPDGLPGVEQAYGFTFPDENVTTVDEDALVFTQVDGGQCTFGSIAATDGRVKALGLTVLEDDKKFFPPYNPAPTVRTEVVNRAPGLRELFAPVAAALDTDTIITLNAEVDVDGKDPVDVARGWLDRNRNVVPQVNLAGQSFTVGSKEFTEQLVLGQLSKLLLEGAGATVTDQTGLVGSETVRGALTSGQIDLYWEYTGTAWVTYLKNTQTVPDPAEQFQRVKDADAANGITWLDMAPFNNTYALTMTNERSQQLGITRISQIGELIAAG
jgi:osmoprotectant transport system substrate-binding protein